MCGVRITFSLCVCSCPLGALLSTQHQKNMFIRLISKAASKRLHAQQYSDNNPIRIMFQVYLHLNQNKVIHSKLHEEHTNFTWVIQTCKHTNGNKYSSWTLHSFFSGICHSLWCMPLFTAIVLTRELVSLIPLLAISSHILCIVFIRIWTLIEINYACKHARWPGSGPWVLNFYCPLLLWKGYCNQI